MASCTDETLPIRGMECTVHTWNNTEKDPRGIAVVYHGFLAHGKYPTVRYAAELLASQNYIVVAADLPGHGSSPGTRGYLPSASILEQDGVTVAQYALDKFTSGSNGKKIPLFLVGSSMGGTIALAVSLQLPQDIVKGVILLAPMLAIDVNEPSRLLLKGLSYIAPTLQVIPSSSTSAEKQYRDAEKRQECETDELSIPGSTIRIGSACTCVELCKLIQTKFSHVKVPLLCMIAGEDVVVDNSGARQLMETSPSTDKTIKEYKALHGLLCEPSPLVDEIQADLLEWLQELT